MKYLAILKDSFREAIDFKIFYVLIGLSLFMIVLVASLSFETTSPNDIFRQKVERGAFRQVRADRGRSLVMADIARARFQLDRLKEASQGSNPEDRDYDLTIQVEDSQPHGFWRTVNYWAKENPMMGTHIQNSSDEKPSRETVKAFFIAQFRDSGTLVSSVNFVSATEPTQEMPEGSYKYVVRTVAQPGAHDWPKKVNFLFGLFQLPVPISVGMVVYFIQTVLIAGLGATIALVISLIVTAFFIPNMLRKGTVDVLISKPVHRTTLLLFKYLGGLTFMFLITTFTIGGVWLVMGVRFGVWAPGFLLSILMLTFFFAVLYSISTLFAVLTRSTIASILLTIFVWFLFFFVGFVHNIMDALHRGAPGNVSPGLHSTTGILKDIVPTVNLGQLNARIIADSVLTESEQSMVGIDRQPEIDRVKSVLVPCIWIVAMLGLACWRFAVRDF